MVFLTPGDAPETARKIALVTSGWTGGGLLSGLLNAHVTAQLRVNVPRAANPDL